MRDCCYDLIVFFSDRRGGDSAAVEHRKLRQEDKANVFGWAGRNPNRSFDEKGSYFTLSKEKLRKNAKTLCLNIVAFADLSIGYALAIFMQTVCLPAQRILLFVAAATSLLLLLEYGLTILIARIKYRKDFNFTEDEAGNMIPVGAIVLRKCAERKIEARKTDCTEDLARCY